MYLDAASTNVTQREKIGLHLIFGRCEECQLISTKMVFDKLFWPNSCYRHAVSCQYKPLLSLPSNLLDELISGHT